MNVWYDLLTIEVSHNYSVGFIFKKFNNSTKPQYERKKEKWFHWKYYSFIRQNFNI